MNQNEMQTNNNQNEIKGNDINNIQNQSNENNLNSSSNEQPLTNPVPMNEVKIEEVSNQVATQPNSNPKNNKISTILLILLFVFLFAFIMGMPYINSFINDLKSNKGLSDIEQAAKKEEKKQQEEDKKNNPTTNVEEKLTELTCTLTDNNSSNYQLTTIQKFEYNKNNQVITSSYISKYVFSTIDSTYQTLKDKCNNDSLKYISREGYTMSCSYSDDSIEVGDTFELETFKTINDGATVIKSNATYQQDINDIKNNLINQGYNCE